MSSTPENTPDPTPDATAVPHQPAGTEPGSAPGVNTTPPPPQPTEPTTPIETLYAAPGSSAGSSGATPVGFTAPAASPRRWSGRRTAAVAGIALALGAMGTVGIAAALPHDATASIGDRNFGPGGQHVQGQWPGAPGSAGQGPGGAWNHDSVEGGPGWLGGPGRDHDDDGDHLGAGDDGGWSGQAPGNPPQGGSGGDLSQLGPNGSGATHTT